ncbi:hypothetical protein TNCT_154851 [Trichonephila clavata]|uniref:Uncharacterized protein n=1 Tax=Trichonephila clavata TaxID=2740835 RepID=A0A8X6J9X9_TRICU|nr:hypothetical protein TNCT_154851 [Trichonephila clavata]
MIKKYKKKRQEELATAALHSTGGCISRTSISKHSTGPADDSFSRSLLQFGGTPERGIHPDTLEPTPGSFQSPMEHRNEAHTTPLLPDGPRKFHKSKTSPRHFLLSSSQVSL